MEKETLSAVCERVIQAAFQQGQWCSVQLLDLSNTTTHTAWVTMALTVNFLLNCKNLSNLR